MVFLRELRVFVVNNIFKLMRIVVLLSYKVEDYLLRTALNTILFVIIRIRGHIRNLF